MRRRSGSGPFSLMVAKVKMKNGSVVEINSCQQAGSARNVKRSYCRVEEGFFYLRVFW